MATSSSASYGFSLTGQFWNPGFDPSNPFDVDNPTTSQFDEHSYWYWVGELDGTKGYEQRTLLIAEEYRPNYDNGYSDGLWKGKILRQG
jgi:hypothetical protein